MTTLREAAQQALWALQYHVEMTWPIDRTSEAIFNLRAALAQTEPAQKQVTYSTGGLHLDAGFYSEVDLRRMLKAMEGMNAAARRAMEETQ